MSAVVSFEQTQKPKLLARLAEKYGIDQDKMVATLKATAFKGEVSNEQLMALCVIAEQYNLNPWLKEIYAYPDRGGIVPVVGVDGWSRIINEKPECDGIEFKEAEDGSWVECTIHRKDRSHPTSAREYLVECKRETGPWKSHPRRMLRHKALIQCARIAFGFGGIFEQDEAERIVEAAQPQGIDPRGDLSAVDPKMVDKFVGEVTDTLAMDKDENEIAAALREVDAEHQKFQEVYIATADALAKRGIISKANYKKYLKVGIDRGETHT